jgi:hypothetical protein
MAADGEELNRGRGEWGKKAMEKGANRGRR